MVIFSVNAVPGNILISVWFQKMGYGIYRWKPAYFCCSLCWELKLADNLAEQLCKLLQCDIIYTCTLFLGVVFWLIRAFLKSSILKSLSGLSPSLNQAFSLWRICTFLLVSPSLVLMCCVQLCSILVSNCWLKIKANLRFSVIMFCSLEKKNVFLSETKRLQQLISHVY